VVPFHFWLADAYAVAPSPVCAVFSAAMAELGLYAIARVYWTVFSGVLGAHAADLRGVLLAFGALTALTGAGMALAQHNLKRMLGFVTISHLGLFLIGIGLLGSAGLAGAAVYLVADGLLKAALFLGVGLFVEKHGSSDDRDLRGAGRELVTGTAILAVGGLVLAGLPPFGPFLGKSLVEGAATHGGHTWALVAIIASIALTGGAVLRAAARLLEPARPEGGEHAGQTGEAEEEAAASGGGRRALALMGAPAVGLLVAALALGPLPGLSRWAHAAAEHFSDRPAYAALVLHDRAPPAAHPPADAGPKPQDYGYAAIAVLGALAVAAAALRAERSKPRVPALLVRLGAGVRDLHSGHVGDYVAWITLGTVVLGGVLAVTVR
jgi:multicomponent Na+:H+ antiporter subunit D